MILICGVPIGLTQDQFQIQASSAVHQGAVDFFRASRSKPFGPLRPSLAVLHRVAERSAPLRLHKFFERRNYFGVAIAIYIEIKRWNIAMVAVVAMDGSWHNRRR